MGVSHSCQSERIFLNKVVRLLKDFAKSSVDNREFYWSKFSALNRRLFPPSEQVVVKHLLEILEAGLKGGMESERMQFGRGHYAGE